MINFIIFYLLSEAPVTISKVLLSGFGLFSFVPIHYSYELGDRIIAVLYL